jgi:hypothetical protein
MVIWDDLGWLDGTIYFLGLWLAVFLGWSASGSAGTLEETADFGATCMTVAVKGGCSCKDGHFLQENSRISFGRCLEVFQPYGSLRFWGWSARSLWAPGFDHGHDERPVMCFESYLDWLKIVDPQNWFRRTMPGHVWVHCEHWYLQFWVAIALYKHNPKTCDKTCLPLGPFEAPCFSQVPRKKHSRGSVATGQSGNLGG